MSVRNVLQNVFYVSLRKVEITVGWSGSGTLGKDSPEDGVS